MADGWQHGPTVDKGARWEPAELGPVVTTCCEGAAARAGLRRLNRRRGERRSRIRGRSSGQLSTRFFSSRIEFFSDWSRIRFFIGPGTKKPTSATMSTVTSVPPSSRGVNV